MSSFLPKGYESLKSEKAYWKMSQMKETGNRLRIVMQPIAGWLDWKDAKPYRYRPDNKPAKAFDASKPIKPFWSCYVWDYTREGLFILEITQASILKSIAKFATDEDWGDFLTYDIKITKEGSGKETRYVVTPLPHKPINEKIQEALKKSPVRLEALYDSGDPWTDLTPIEINESTGEIIQQIVKPSAPEISNDIESLTYMLKADGVETDQLESFISNLSKKKNEPIPKIIGSAIKLLPQFKLRYMESMAKQTVAV